MWAHARINDKEEDIIHHKTHVYPQQMGRLGDLACPQHPGLFKRCKSCDHDQAPQHPRGRSDQAKSVKLVADDWAKFT